MVFSGLVAVPVAVPVPVARVARQKVLEEDLKVAGKPREVLVLA
jgi:hypothetical protein